jgi:hypothetical protein
MRPRSWAAWSRYCVASEYGLLVSRRPYSGHLPAVLLAADGRPGGRQRVGADPALVRVRR